MLDKTADPPQASSALPLLDGIDPRRWLVLPILLTGAFLLPLDYSIVNVALPAIHDSLGARASEMQLIVTLYAVSYSVFLITGGRLGDLLGRKAMFLGGMSAFMLASAACGFAPTIHVLLAGRLLQGLAAAMLLPQVLATIRVIFPAAEQSRAIGFYGVMVGLGLVCGQLVGGLLISLHPFGFTWQTIFLVNLPVGLVDAVAAALLLRPSRPQRGVRLDIPGVVFLSVALLLLVYPLIVGPEAGWPLWTLAAMGLSAPTLVLFVLFELHLTRQGASPLFDMRLFRDRPFSVGLTLALLVYANAAFFLCYAVYLQSGLGWSVQATGLATLPFSLGFLFGSLSVPRLVPWLGLGAPRLGYVALILGQAATVSLLLRGGAPDVAMFATLACAGLGMGVVFPALVRIVLQDVPPAYAGMASGALNTVIQIGPSLAVPIIGGLFFRAVAGRADAPAYVHGFAAVLTATATVYAVSLGLTFLLRRRSN
jgi:MFS family permease